MHLYILQVMFQVYDSIFQKSLVYKNDKYVLFSFYDVVRYQLQQHLCKNLFDMVYQIQLI